MTLESNLWRNVHHKLSLFGVLKRIENKVDLGTPDVAYLLRRPKQDKPTAGWLELKCLTDFPSKPNTPLNIEHLTLEQVMFLEEWTRSGGNAFMLLQVRDCHFLCDASTTRGIYKRVIVRRQLINEALVSSTLGGFPTRRILECLTP